MKPGDKIKLIKSLSKRLSDVGDWEEIDLTLRVFGLPWTDAWNGSRTNENGMYKYCLEMLESGDEDNLRTLEQYLEGKDAAPETSIHELSGPWQPQRFKLFISHITADKILVSDVKVKLAKFGIDCFVAHEDIRPSKKWMDEIILALDTCDALSAFISEDYHKSSWTDQEVGYCIRRRILILPIGLGFTPYGFMGVYQGAQCKGMDAERISETIFTALITNQRTKARMAESLVSSLETASDFDDAATKARLLNKIEVWSPELLRKLQAAKEGNSQVAGSYVASPLIDKILRLNTFST